ncbi:uncharacterized protein G2W53_034818 [Senna tora]|uniref:Uncharacterized protein n=1 Tax=Senna tora TaxID=362788 RepID=A0A834T4W1_9FABA|nr:uncharacterized protein G2W53_034818 [Senna tora]
MGGDISVWSARPVRPITTNETLINQIITAPFMLAKI